MNKESKITDKQLDKLLTKSMGSEFTRSKKKWRAAYRKVEEASNKKIRKGLRPY